VALVPLWNRAFDSPAKHSLAHPENGTGMIGRGISPTPEIKTPLPGRMILWDEVPATANPGATATASQDGRIFLHTSRRG
jgi:hypothetical protein